MKMFTKLGKQCVFFSLFKIFSIFDDQSLIIDDAS